MTYQLRFESNALEADSMIGKALDELEKLTKKVRRSAGMKLREDQADKIVKLRGICQNTFARSMDWADKDFDQQMVSEKWSWQNNDPENKTYRKNGEIVTTPRDIVDTGDLLQSKTRIAIDSSTTEFNWTDPIAGFVHDGGTWKSGLKAPARPWTQPVLQDIDSVVASFFNKGGR